MEKRDAKQDEMATKMLDLQQTFKNLTVQLNALYEGRREDAEAASLSPTADKPTQDNAGEKEGS
jgi:hypothetical protein